jgi:signal transduction histidine kinase
MKLRASTWIAWSLWVLALAGLFSPVVYRYVFHGSIPGLGGDPGSLAATIAVLIFLPTFATVGAVLASRRPSNPIGWILSVAALCYGVGASAEFFKKYSTQWADWLGWIWGLGLGLAAMYVLLLFPTGRLPSRRWRPVAWIGAVGLGAFVLGNMFAPGLISGTTSTNPIGIGGPIGSVFKALRPGVVVIPIVILASIVSIVIRYRRAGSVERQQLKWLVYAAGFIVIGILAQPVISATVSSSELATNLQNATISLSVTLVPVALAIAILKYRLYDIDLVINKTLVYGLLAAFITAVYVAIVVGIGQAVGSTRNLGLSILATAVVAVGFQPVRDQVQHLANRLVYGKRATPYEVLSEFSERMSGTYATEDLLPRMARILGEGAGAIRADVWLKVGNELRPAASWPAEGEAAKAISLSAGSEVLDAAGSDLLLPVKHRGELLGALSITKARGEALRLAEEKLTEDLASQAGLVLRNVRLTDELLQHLKELQASRQRIVAAQDEERRKLERNLHDGAQQQLVALQVKLSLAERIAEEGCRVKDQLGTLRAEAGEALENLRDLARGIYPPLLADQGLTAALQAQARKATFPVAIEADGIERYPQEAEAAVYFCVLEALQNVAKYAEATHATVRIAEDDGQVAFEVQDDGAGFDTAKTSYGTGLQGMADRLSAQGGTLEVTSLLGHGTTVSGRVPVRELQFTS